MIVYIGQTGDKKFLADIEAYGFGRMWSSGKPSRCYDGEPLALDNGAYSAWKSGKEWDGGKFLSKMERVKADGITPDFVVIPDVIGESRESVLRSWHWSDKMPNKWPVYLALQDGITEDCVRHFCRFVDGLFLGGLPAFQHSTAGRWVEIARECGVKIHWGGVGRLWELGAALRLGYDSVDSSQMLWSRDHWARWLREYRNATTSTQLTMPGIAT